MMSNIFYRWRVGCASSADILPNQRLITGSVKNAGMICISFPGMCGGTIVAVFDDVAEGQEVDP